MFDVDLMPKRIKAARALQGFSQVELAKRTGTTQHAIACYETGRNRPNSFTLAMLATALGVTSDYLLGKVVTQ